MSKGGVYDDLELSGGTWRPYTAIQMVMTVDGAIKGPTDDYWPISQEADQRTFRRFRIHFDAVLHGTRTLGMRIDRYMWSAELQCERRQRGLYEPPLFIVVSNSGRIDPSDRVFQRRSYPIAPLVVVPEAAKVTEGLSEVAEIVRIGDELVDLESLMRYLAAERDVRRLVCEGGAILNFHMLAAGLVDEFFITVTPSIIGEPRPRTAVEGPAALPHDQLQQLELVSTITHGDEVFLRYRVGGASSLA
ncbi:MAG: RibD family protein [Chloroflexota bacterium]|nr:RibD family protein [Chloroflexota bacterium]MDE2919987.1 RibD family protein [Chloroflexota bacterium]